MNTNYRKLLKFATLLVTSILIASVSATTYKYMFINGTVTISTTTGLNWVKGSDAPTGTNIAGGSVSVPFTVQNGTAMNFTYCLYLKNLDTSSHPVQINVTTPATSSLYDKFNIMIFNNASQTFIHTLNALTTDSYSSTITSSQIWRLLFQINAKSTASGSDTFVMEFTYQ
jgi:hypothetical protein